MELLPCETGSVKPNGTGRRWGESALTGTGVPWMPTRTQAYQSIQSMISGNGEQKHCHENCERFHPLLLPHQSAPSRSLHQKKGP